MYRRMYYDEREWEIIEEDAVLEVFDNYFCDGKVALESLRNDGFDIHTTAARYQYIEEDKAVV